MSDPARWMVRRVKVQCCPHQESCGAERYTRLQIDAVCPERQFRLDGRECLRLENRLNAGEALECAIAALQKIAVHGSDSAAPLAVVTLGRIDALREKS